MDIQVARLPTGVACPGHQRQVAATPVKTAVSTYVSEKSRRKVASSVAVNEYQTVLCSRW